MIVYKFIIYNVMLCVILYRMQYNYNIMMYIILYLYNFMSNITFKK